VRKSILLLLLVTTCAVGCASLPKTENNADMQAQEMLIGTWTRDYSKESGKPTFIEYKRDGTAVAKVFDSFECNTLIVELHGTWYVENGVLYTIVKSSTDENWRSTDAIIKDKIIKLTGNYHVLLEGEDYYHYRTRGKICE
jgi:hypothetical protein